MFQLPWLGGYLRNSDQYSLGWRKGCFTTVTLQSIHSCLPDSIDTQGAEKYCARRLPCSWLFLMIHPIFEGKKNTEFPRVEPYAIATSRWMNEWSVWNYGNPKLTGRNAHVHSFSCIFMHVHSFSFIAPIEIANHCPQVGGKFTVKMDSSPAQLVPNSTVKSPLRQSPNPRCCRRRVAAFFSGSQVDPGATLLDPCRWCPVSSNTSMFNGCWNMAVWVGGWRFQWSGNDCPRNPTLPAEIVRLRQIDKMCPMVI